MWTPAKGPSSSAGKKIEELGPGASHEHGFRFAFWVFRIFGGGGYSKLCQSIQENVYFSGHMGVFFNMMN